MPQSKKKIFKAHQEEIETRREKFQGCQHCQASTHLQSASHHCNTADSTSIKGNDDNANYSLPPPSET
ncbi:hypothetical protein CMV_020423 [Castanea mollissima]|uniref:Uncharacterized protein n=1 Tax=Castanea mollissima TaxID=60419 RepID=A0A8J4QYK9_9ROSI|nr:hypothetical protein CMV_020423 [Castanea mollissima]